MLDPRERLEPSQFNAAPGPNYDVVIVGGGLHALALSYYLGNSQAISSVAVIAKGTIYGSASGAPLAAITPQPWRASDAELGLRSGPLFDEIAHAVGGSELRIRRDQLIVARTADELNSCRWRVELAKSIGGQSSLIDANGVRSVLAALAPETSVAGGQLTPEAGVLRLDETVAAYAQGAVDAGVGIFESTPVVGVVVEENRVLGVRTTSGLIKAAVVVVCAPGWAGLVADMAGVKLPTFTRRHESLVSEPSDLDLPVVAGFESAAVEIAPVGQGSVFVSGAVSPFGTYSGHRSLAASDQLASGALALVPSLERTRVHRHYSSVIDVTSDGFPVVGATSVDGLLASAGWGVDGVAIAPAVASELAASIAHNELSPLLEPFALDRLFSGSRRSVAP